MWNALVDQFADRPVQFVWITAEYQPPLGPWLREHPLKGWVFLDPLGATAMSYGVEELAAVIVGTDRRIIGFEWPALPSPHTLNAALEGRITADTAIEGASAGSGMAHLKAELPLRPHEEMFRPDLPPSETVHISPARSAQGTTLSTGGDHWAALGFTLKGLLAEAYGMHESFMDLAKNLDAGIRYDVIFVPPKRESPDKIIGRIRRAIEQHFRLDISRQIRSMKAYVLSPPDGRAAFGPFGGQVGWAAVEVFSKPDAAAKPTRPQTGPLPFPERHLPAIGGAAVFAHLGLLPFSRGLLTVGEIGPEGYYAIDIVCIGHYADEELFRTLREDLGIVTTKELRDLEMLVVRRRRLRGGRAASSS
jgi:hypothetical protein